MDSLLFKPDVLKGKIRACELYGEAQARRLQKSLDTINEEPDKWGVNTWHFDARGNRQWIFQYDTGYKVIKPRHHKGIVYAKEAWRLGFFYYKKYAEIQYADKTEIKVPWNDWLTKHTEYNIPPTERHKWRSPMFLLEDFARHFFEITDIGAERFYLNKLTAIELAKEGYLAAVSQLKKLDGLWVFCYTLKLAERKAI